MHVPWSHTCIYTLILYLPEANLLWVSYTHCCPSGKHCEVGFINRYNSQRPSITLLELTCPLDSAQHIQAARDRKQNKAEYLQLLAEFDRLNIPHYYDTIEITVLDHYQLSTVKNILYLLTFVYPVLSISKSSIKECLDDAASASILASRRIFLAKDCK